MTLFIIGVLVGYTWYPLWKVVKKIHRNAMKAQEEATGDR